jgi:hypothetical protein
MNKNPFLYTLLDLRLGFCSRCCTSIAVGARRSQNSTPSVCLTRVSNMYTARSDKRAWQFFSVRCVFAFLILERHSNGAANFLSSLSHLEITTRQIFQNNSSFDSERQQVWKCQTCGVSTCLLSLWYFASRYQGGVEGFGLCYSEGSWRMDGNLVTKVSKTSCCLLSSDRQNAADFFVILRFQSF